MLGVLETWLKKKDGVAATEFALIGGPFIFMLLGIIELSLMFAMQTSLEAATVSASRIIRTGQLQQSGSGDLPGDFREAICGDLFGVIPCDDIDIQVVSVDSFGDADNLPDATFDEDGNLEDQQFNPGGSSDVVLVRVAYRYEIFNPMFSPILVNHESNVRIMQSAVVFQTEPYDFGEEEA